METDRFDEKVEQRVKDAVKSKSAVEGRVMPDHGQMTTIIYDGGKTDTACFTTHYFPPDGAFVIDNSTVISIGRVSKWAKA